MAKFLRRLLTLIALAYAAVVLFMVWREPTLVYPAAFDDARDRLPPAIEGDIVTERYVSSSDASLPGRRLDRGDDKPWVIFFHGNGERARQLDRWLTRLADAVDANVFAAEYRGFEDDVPPDEAGVTADGIAALRHVTETIGVDPGRVILWGRSLGGGVATSVAADAAIDRRPVGGLVLERTFDSTVNVAADAFPWLPVRVLMRNRFDSAARVANLSVPTAVVVGDVDVNVPAKHGRRLFDRSGGRPKRLWDVPGMGHLEPLPDQTLSEVAAWIRSQLPPDGGSELSGKPTDGA